MKSMSKAVLSSVLIAYSVAGKAQIGPEISVGGVAKKPFEHKNQQQDQLATLIDNLGLYMGYDLQKKPSDVSDELIDYSNTGISEMYSYMSLLGAVPVNVIVTNGGGLSPYKDFSYFVPETSPLASTLNPQWNYSFRTPAFSSAEASNGGSVVASEMMDQTTGNKGYMLDPVTQGLYNIIGTPDDSYCMDWAGDNYVKGCQYLTKSRVMNNVVGTLPGDSLFFTFDYTKNFMSELNSNNLLAPLLYSTEVKNTGKNQFGGLTAKSQAQLANNFARYASGLVTPLKLAERKAYSDLYQQADVTDSGNTDFNSKMSARARLSSYLSSLRAYAARYSIGLSNVYAIMARRMPQNFTNDPSTGQTSQALEEFKMATWRLYKLNSNGSGSAEKNQQWLDKINNGSAATVQKEMAVLLAEINYQMYLSRQQQERILLTNSINMMLTNASTAPALSSNDGTQPAN